MDFYVTDGDAFINQVYLLCRKSGIETPYAIIQTYDNYKCRMVVNLTAQFLERLINANSIGYQELVDKYTHK